MVKFRERLAEKMSATHKKATEDKDYTTFLKHFDTFKVATVDIKEVSGQEFIIEEMQEIKALLRGLRNKDVRDRSNRFYLHADTEHSTSEKLYKFVNAVSSMPGVENVTKEKIVLS